MSHKLMFGGAIDMDRPLPFMLTWPMTSKTQRGSQPRLVREAILQEIGDGTFRPGMTLSIAGLAQKCRTSPTPVREALCLLVGERVVIEDERGGYLVRRLGSEQVASYYDLRALLFSVALKRVRRARRGAELLRCTSAADVVRACCDDVIGEQWANVQRILLPYTNAELLLAGSLSLPALHTVDCERQLVRWMNEHSRRCTKHAVAIIAHSHAI